MNFLWFLLMTLTCGIVGWLGALPFTGSGSQMAPFAAGCAAYLFLVLVTLFDEH